MLKMQFFLTFILQVSNSSSPVGRAILPHPHASGEQSFLMTYIMNDWKNFHYICNYALAAEEISD
jgi:hypothetical protein